MSYPLVAGTVALIVAFVWGSITYVYRDAPRRGMDGDQWAGVLALTLGLGVFLYLYRRPALDDVEEPAVDAS
ncbi:hypothetical protein L593_05780 [Salinarchaeum sp. Harcht-Bsk1]|uniref:hypothetical protein n=1 Tax=Salinarchaeum sp. Harcht-Bsk1 TaxID=1333523 RepID=UPI00034232F3|nr:hypothetical protein [Salinarchaeum sp. Harcht-Bsk1]AGN01105.1 hypothetical protein L593_05780 [Salinarchaeum sp. Harcht-Bsk1]